jgi:hypothetical protein
LIAIKKSSRGLRAGNFILAKVQVPRSEVTQYNGKPVSGLNKFPANRDEPKIKNLLEPDFRKWLNE